MRICGLMHRDVRFGPPFANHSRMKDPRADQDILKLKELISGIQVAMLTTLNADGTLHSRPMWTQQVDFDGDLWFFTSHDSPKTQELRHDSHVTVTYSDPSANRYVSVCGRGQIVTDRQRAEKLWSEAYRAWFPQGLDDPRLCLIRIPVERAEYWDSPSSKVVHLVGYVKAVATGKPYEPGPGEHGKIDVAS